MNTTIYLDISGSMSDTQISQMKKMAYGIMFNAGQNVTLKTFDTEVKLVSHMFEVFSGGGGTYINCVELDILKTHPDEVFIISDMLHPPVKKIDGVKYNFKSV
jgi:predicted metal-dependent peptidase